MLKKTGFYRLICIIALLTLSLNAASPVSPTQASQIDPQGSDPSAPAFKPLTSASPLAQPSINAKPVLERARQMGDGPEQRIQRAQTPALNKLGEQQALSSTPDKKQAAQTPSKPVDGRLPAALQSQASLPSAKSAGKTNPPVFNQVSSLPTSVTQTCTASLNDSDFEGDNAIWWTEYVPNVYTDTTVYASATTSLWMLEAENGDTPVGGDIDAFGQVFYFPDASDGIDVDSLEISVKTAEFAGQNDSLYIFFYEADSAGEVIWDNYLGGKSVPLVGTGEWTSHYFPVSNNDPDLPIESLKGKNVAMVLAAFGDDDLTTRYDISVDDVYMDLCTSPTQPTGQFNGQVTQANGQAGDSGLSDAVILLTYEDSTTDGPQVIDFTLPDFNGYYSFGSLYPLPAGGTYQVWFMNIFEDDTRVMLWAGPSTDILNDGDTFTAYSFDISNVVLNYPANEAMTAFNSGITFHWSGRSVANEDYYLCMYDELSQLDYNTVCSTMPTSGTSLTLTVDSFSEVSEFIVYGHRYLWYVLPVSIGIGYSYYANGITLLAKEPPVINPPTPTDPWTVVEPKREWLLMIYLAGDNNLGDPAKANSPSSFIKHFETLQKIAPAYGNIHVVTLTDFYDSSGTQICYISVSPARCQQLGEQETNNPVTLTNFIKTAMEKFPGTYTALVISDHGHGVSGLAVDETTHRKGVTTLDGYMMNPTKLRAALTSAGLKTTPPKLDLLYFNTCLMGNLETAYTVKDFAKYMVASSNEMWMMDIYTAMLPLINGKTVADKTLATGLAQAYAAKVAEDAPGYPISIGAYDLSFADDVWQAVSNLGAELSTLYDDSSQAALKNKVKIMRIEAQQYDSSGDERIDQEDAFTDLLHLVTLMSNEVRMPNAEVRLLATAVKNLLSSLVMYSYQSSGVTGDGIPQNLGQANGLSVYFPDRNEGTQLTLTHEISEKLSYYATGNAWITYTDKFVQYILGNPNTNPGGASTSGPAHITSGVLPPNGALAQEFGIFLPAVRR